MRRLISIVFIAALLLVPGCWDLMELNQISVVGIVGIDYDAQGDGFAVTVHLHHPTSSGNQEQGGSQTNGMMVVTTRGQTIMDALRNLRSTAGYKVTFHHVRLIVIVEDLARKGVSPVLPCEPGRCASTPCFWSVRAAPQIICE